MDFNQNEAIYLQIAGYISEAILSNRIKGGEKIPSVRDIAIQLQVNPNTAMRAYENLQSRDIIYNKRGIGFFVNESALEKIKEERRSLFVNARLPEIFKEMNLLNISLEELTQLFHSYNKPNTDSNETQQ